MNKIGCIFITAITALVLAGPEALYASMLNQEDGILPNHSAEYVRTQSRNASTDADAAYYNPAGLAFMKKEGLHLMISNQALYVKKEHSFRYVANTRLQPAVIPWHLGTHLDQPYFYTTNNKYLVPDKYSADIFSPVLPDVDLIYKGKNWAAYLDISVTQAAPHLVFPQGVADMDRAIIMLNESLANGTGNELDSIIRSAQAARTEYYIAGTVGGSYAFLNWFSAALACRFIYVTANQNLKQIPAVETLPATNTPMLIDVDLSGHGFGIIGGFDFKPLKSLNIGVRYEYYPPMVLKKKTNKFFAHPTIVQSGNLNIFADSWNQLIFNDNLWGLLGGCLWWDMDPRWVGDVGNKFKATYPPSVSIGVSYNILENMRIETSADLTFPNSRDLDGRENNFKKIGYRIGQCMEWSVIPMIVHSIGYSYNDFGVKPGRRTEVDPLLSSHTVSGGLTIKAMESLDITVGGYYSIFTPAKNDTMDVVSSWIMGGFVYDMSAHYWKKTFNETRWGLALGITIHAFGEGSMFGPVLKKNKSENI